MKRRLITSALPYANGYIHFGHIAGAFIPGDIYARYSRLKGENVLYVCGSDEYGVAITIAAEKEGVTPKDIIDKYHFANKVAFENLGMSFDIYSRTSEPNHADDAKEFFADFLKKGLLLEKEENQFYDDDAKMFLPDRYVEGICPNCGKDKARGDQCDNCGAYYNQVELKNPISKISGKTPSIKATTHWYFKFQDFQLRLEEYINSNEKEWKDNVIAQTRSWLNAGLVERAITRDLDWGIHLDGIQGIDTEKTKGKALYVWFEAVLGYISATKEITSQNAKYGNWKDWWQSEDTDYIAFIGKDNIVFHTLIFPAMLMARKDIDNPYILPKNVPANEFLNLEGQKFSKSNNWSIDLKDFIAENNTPSMIDSLRYTLAMNAPETKDADFTWKDFQARSNNELSAIFGNFVNRSLQFLHKNFEGKVPDFSYSSDFILAFKNLERNLNNSKIFDINDNTLFENLISGVKNSSENFEKYRFRDGISDIMNIARSANKYFNDSEPWKTVKSNPDEAAKTLYVCCQLVSSLSILLSPILPHICSEIQTWLGSDITIGNSNESIKNDIWESAKYPTLEIGKSIAMPTILISKVEDSFVEEQKSKLGNKASANENALSEELIDIEDFKKIKLRTAKIISAEKIEKSKKLLKLQVEIAGETRQILAGIAEHYKLEEIIGKKIVIVANLKPAKLMGLESQGMLLAANSEEGLSVIFIDDVVGTGAEVR